MEQTCQPPCTAKPRIAGHYVSLAAGCALPVGDSLRFSWLSAAAEGDAHAVQPGSARARTGGADAGENLAAIALSAASACSMRLYFNHATVSH